MKQLFSRLANTQRQEQEALAERRQELLRLWGVDPWFWLTGRDLDGKPIIWTQDERDDEQPIKPFPTDKPYLRRLVQDAFDPQVKDLFIDKARQMMVTTTLLLAIDWYCRFRVARRCLVSKHKEGEALDLLRDKIRAVHARLPLWVQAASPMTATPAKYISYPVTGSSVMGVPQNFAEAEARGQTASLILIDEAAFQDVLGDIITAISAMATRMWAVSSPQLHGRGAAVFKSYLRDIS